MAKMKFFGLLFSFFNLLLISWTPILASNEMEPARLEQCNLPAPDSFRITQVGGDFIKLAWNAIFPGALHQLTVMESDGNGGYVTILVENNVSGNTYIAGSLLPGTGYRFILATKCASGEPSSVKTYIDGITLIVDLLVSGRKPVNPTPVESCNFVPAEYPWAGFNVYKIGENPNANNYFEVIRLIEQTPNGNSQEKFQVFRHNLNGDIFSVNNLGFWPDCDVPLLKINGTRFRVDRKLPTGFIEQIGYVDVSFNLLPPSLKFCPDYEDLEYPWNPEYAFEPIVSVLSRLPNDCEEGETLKRRPKNMLSVSYSNPFSSEIWISIIESEQEYMVQSIAMYNLFGELVAFKQIDEGVMQFSIPTTNIVDGIYTLQFKTNEGLVTKMLIKNSQ